MPSPSCEVRNGSGPYQSTDFGVDITPGNVVTIRLADQTDVDSWSIACLTTDELSDKDAINAALVIDNATKTATFTSSVAFGRTLRFVSRINNGKDQNFVERDDYTTTFCIYATTVGGLRVLAADERLEGDPDFGWIASYNSAIRTPPSGEINTVANVGGGIELYKEKFGAELRFRTLVAGVGIALTQNSSTVQIAAPVPTGTGFRKVVGGVEQAAAEPVDLADATERTGTLPTGSGGTGNANLSFPSGTRTMVARDSSDTLTNKTIDSASNAITLATSVLTSGVLGTARGGTGIADTTLVANSGLLLRANASGSGAVELVEPLMGIGEIGHRLTLTSGTPIPTSDVSSATTIFLTPFIHNFIHLWDGTRWRFLETSEISLALGTLTSGKNYDVFAYYTGSAVALELSAAWTNDTTRADALARRNGVLVKSSNQTRRYVGTIRTISTTQTASSGGKRFVWNYYNRVPLKLLRQESANSWSYSGTSYRAANNSTANSVEFITGDSSWLDLTVATYNTATATGWGASIGLGFDSTTANNARIYGGITSYESFSGLGLFNYVRAEYRDYPSVGYHIVYWTEISGGITVTFYGTVGNTTFFQFGILGSIVG